MTHPKPTDSPWGPVQHATELLPGVWAVTTAGHGGIHAAPELNRLIPEAARDPGGWYEEDEQWCIPWVHLGVPRRATWPAGVDRARDALKHHFPGLYEAHFGVTLQPGESRTRDHETFLAAHRDAYIASGAVTPARNANIPPGMCGVTASRGGRWCQDEPLEHFLIDAERFEQLRQASPFGCVITEEFTPATPDFRPLSATTHLPIP